MKKIFEQLWSARFFQAFENPALFYVVFPTENNAILINACTTRADQSSSVTFSLCIDNDSIKKFKLIQYSNFNRNYLQIKLYPSLTRFRSIMNSFPQVSHLNSLTPECVFICLSNFWADPKAISQSWHKWNLSWTFRRWEFRAPQELKVASQDGQEYRFVFSTQVRVTIGFSSSSEVKLLALLTEEVAEFELAVAKTLSNCWSR